MRGLILAMWMWLRKPAAPFYGDCVTEDVK